MTPRPVGWARRAAILLGSALLALSPAAAGASPGAPAAKQICVGVVVAYDGAATAYGTGSNSYCAKVASGSTGFDVLDARAQALGRPPPRIEDGGLLCSIDGYPRTGCGAADPRGGYDYWSYWHRAPGTSAWTYSSVGAGEFQPVDGAEEGWAWEQGQQESGAQRPPLVAFTVVCPPAQPATQSPTPGAITSAASRGTTVAGSTSPLATSPVPASPSDSPSASASHTRSPTAPTATTSGPAAAPTTSPAAVTRLVTAIHPAGHRSRWLPLLVGVLLIATIGGAAWRRARSR